MTKKQEQNASFMVRFNQRIFEENGDSKIQWRGKVTHVQDGDEKRFSDFNDALTFMQNKLAELTEEATKHETSEKQESIEQANSELIIMMKEFDEQTTDSKEAEIELDRLINKAKNHIETDKEAIEFETLLIEIENFYISVPNKSLNKNGVELKNKIVLHIKSMNHVIDYVLTSRSYFPFLRPFFSF